MMIAEQFRGRTPVPYRALKVGPQSHGPGTVRGLVEPGPVPAKDNERAGNCNYDIRQAHTTVKRSSPKASRTTPAGLARTRAFTKNFPFKEMARGLHKKGDVLKLTVDDRRSNYA